jgi:NRAMP (natural resistance-associated macrophage protein)-like metal ion transporter
VSGPPRVPAPVGSTPAPVGSTPAPAAPARVPSGRYLRPSRVRMAAMFAVLGPGLVSSFADNDAGGITTYSLAGAHYGYQLLWVLVVTLVALFVTQEVGARIGLATGQGLTGLTRERFGVRWAAFLAIALLVANLGTTVAEFAGIGAALGLFGVPLPVSAIIAAVAMVLLISRGSYSRIQVAFVAVGVGVAVAYALSAIMAEPDWGQAAAALVPHISDSPAYWLTVVAMMGTTVTPWGQAFIQAYVVDKNLGPEDLANERIDVGLGSLIANVVAAFILIACAATLWTAGVTNVTDAAQVAQALGPLVGEAATVVFALGLLAASLLGLGVVPLSSAYTACEAFGWEAGVDNRWRQAPAFYTLLAFFVGFAAVFVLIPGLPLIQVMFLTQVVNGVLLPIVLVFVLSISADRRMMGDLVSGRLLLTVGWVVTAVLALLSVLLVATALLA